MTAANDPVVTRRLAAIVIADVVGYTRLMERDDTGTFARLRSIRDEVVDPAIVSHDGRIVKTAGDGLLAEFPSALAALRASVQIQREMAKRNEGVAAEERIDYRIGINLGDIMVDGSDIVSDGVNVASRLEALAEAGGICVSGSVREQVHGQLAVSFVDIGERQVKNIQRPIRVFAVTLAATDSTRASRRRPWYARWASSGATTSGRQVRRGLVVLAIAVVAAGVAAIWWQSRATSVPDPPAMSVGILPLAASNESRDTSSQREAMTRDLISQLVRADIAIRVVPVAESQLRAANTRRSSALVQEFDVRYVLEGEVQPGQSTTETRLRLVNGASGEQVWSETISLNDSASPADRIRLLRTAMEHLRNRLFEVEMRRATAAGERGRAPMDYVLRAQALDQTDKSLDRLRRQEALYEEALRRDADLVPALLGLTEVFDGQLDLDVNVDRARLVRRWDEVTSRAVNLNRTAPETWKARSGALMLMGRWDAALEASAKAIQLDPGARWLVTSRAWDMSMVGRPGEALSLVEHAMAMDPPGSWFESRVACEAHLLLGQYDDALAACEKATGRGGDEFDIAYFLAAAYAHTGNSIRAREEAAKILKGAPGFTIATLRAKQYSTHPDYMRLAEEHWYSGLRKAEIPEQ